MKKYSIYLSAASVILALVSCQKIQENIQNEVSPNTAEGSIPFEIAASFANPSEETKTTLNLSTWAVNWEDGNTIYAVTTDEEWGQPYASDNSAETVAEFTYSSSTEKFSTAKTITNGSHTFNFLYSNGTQKSYHRGGGTTFQLYTDQSFDVSNPTANLKAYDALAGQVTATTPTSFVDVSMSHLFTLMKVTIKNKTGADLTATKFELTAKSGTNLYGVFSVTFGATPSVSYSKNGGNTIAVNISNGSIAKGKTIDVYFVMAPLTAYTGDITFKVTDSNSKTYSKTNTISSAINLLAGKHNAATYTIETADATVDAIDFSALGLSNGTAYNDPFAGDDFTITFASGNNNGKYYNTGTAIRAYSGKSFTVASTTKTISKIKLTYGSGDGSNDITASPGTFSTDTWTGSASSVVFTIGGSSGHRRIKKVEVWYTD